MKKQHLFFSLTFYYFIILFLLIKCGKIDKKDKEDNHFIEVPNPIDCASGMDAHAIFKAPEELILNNIPDYKPQEQQQTYAIFKKGGLEGLHYSGLNSKPITNLPEKIGCVKSLFVLKLPENSLTSLPESIGELQHLDKLDLHRNFLEKLPAQFVYLQKLKNLQLGSNDFSEFPKEVLVLKKLEELNLCYNPKIIEIPEEIKNLKQLKVLCLPKMEDAREKEIRQWFNEKVNIEFR